jgi:hypothetical protein
VAVGLDLIILAVALAVSAEMVATAVWPQAEEAEEPHLTVSMQAQAEMAGQDCAGLDMPKKYALVKNNVVQSSFYSELELEECKQSYPDLAEFLIQVDEGVKDNFTFKEGEFFPPDDPNTEADESSKPWWKFW